LGVVNLLNAVACKWRFPREREPERFAKRVDVGPHVERGMIPGGGDCGIAQARFANLLLRPVGTASELRSKPRPSLRGRIS